MLAAIVVLAAALRWFRIDAQSLWYDEGISAQYLSWSFADILRAAAAQDAHPPLYYWTLAAWSKAFGSSELALRSLSAAWGVVAVALTFVLGRRLFGTLAAALAAVLLATTPLAVYYSQEVRMYAQVTALGLLTVYAYARRSNWLYALAGITTLYSQYLGMAFLAAVNVHALVWWRTRSRRQWLGWLAANAAVAIAFAVWLPTFVDQQSHALTTSPRTVSGLLTSTLTAYGGGISEGNVAFWGGAVLLLLALVGALTRVRLEAVSLAALIWLMPLGLVLGLGFRSGLFEVRYLLLSTPGVLLLVARGIANLARWRALLPTAAGAALLPAALGLSAQYFDPSLARDDYRGLVAAIASEAQPGDAVLLVAPNQNVLFNYYYHGDLPSTGLPGQRPIDKQDTLQRLADLRGRYQRIWLVAWAMPEVDPSGVIAGWLADNGFQATHQWYGSTQLSLFSFGAAATTEKVDAALDNGIVLDAYRIGSRTLRPGDTLDLQLVWRAAGGPTLDHWKVFTHLVDGNSAVVAQRDGEPGDNLRPTTSWTHGEQVQDNYGIAIPSDLPAGDYTLEIGMYDGDRRSQIEGYGDHLTLGRVQVTSPESASVPAR